MYLGILTGRLVGHMVAVKVIELGTLTNQKQVEKLAVEISLMKVLPGLGKSGFLLGCGGYSRAPKNRGLGGIWERSSINRAIDHSPHVLRPVWALL